MVIVLVMVGLAYMLVGVVVIGVVLGADIVTSWATFVTSRCRVTHLVTATTLDVYPAALCGISGTPTGCTIWISFAKKTIYMTFLTAFFTYF